MVDYPIAVNLIILPESTEGVILSHFYSLSFLVRGLLEPDLDLGSTGLRLGLGDLGLGTGLDNKLVVGVVYFEI